MQTTLSADVLEDAIAVSLARAMASANKRALEEGVDVPQSLITISQRFFNGDTLWRINYAQKKYVGRRGGDLIIEVDQSGANINQVLWGQ